MSITIKRRQISNADLSQLNSLHPILQQIYLQRGITQEEELQRDLNSLLSFKALVGIEQAVALLYTALQNNQHIMIIGDFDADGATSTALAVRTLRLFGANRVSFLVPNRFQFGYGLTPEIVELAASQQPDLIVTVDNGISSIDGVAVAQAHGIKVLITDHHLPGDTLPLAEAIVNPNQASDRFRSKHLAGVGVCFYVMLALRSKLRETNWFVTQNLTEPNMANLLDLVALGTVADVVPLDKNNRILVYQGLQRIRAGQCVPGIKALLEVAKRKLKRITTADLGFAIGPRLNAAGRLDDMRLGIECLLSDDINEARALANKLNQLNLERRHIEGEMKQQALAILQNIDFSPQTLPHGLCMFDESWHQGVIGILASRLKDQYHRPVIVFADAGDGELKGSARSVKHLHIRDTLDVIAKQHPQLIKKFGGHAMAAGLSIKREKFMEFSNIFAAVVKSQLSIEAMRGEILSDGALAAQEISIGFAELLQNAGPWGQAFPEPIFDDQFEIIEQQLVAGKHLRLVLRHPEGEQVFTAIKFNVELTHWPNNNCRYVHAAYKLDINEFNDFKNIQLLIEYLEPIERF